MIPKGWSISIDENGEWLTIVDPWAPESVNTLKIHITVPDVRFRILFRLCQDLLERK